MTVAAAGDLALNRELLLRYEMMEGARAFKKLSFSQIVSLPEFTVGWLSKHVNTEQKCTVFQFPRGEFWPHESWYESA